MDDLTRLRYEREAKRRRYMCEQCGWIVIEGSICDPEGDEPEGSPESGQQGEVYIDPKRTYLGYILAEFQGKPSPTDHEFSSRIYAALHRHDVDSKSLLDELFAKVRSSDSESANTTIAQPSQVLPPAMLAELTRTIRNEIETAMKRAGKEIFNLSDAAEYLGISVSSIRKQVALGKLRRSGNARSWRFRLEDLREYAALTPVALKKRRAGRRSG